MSQIYDEHNPPPPPAGTHRAIPRWFFGVQVIEELFWDPIHGPLQVLRIVYVYPGTPASVRVEAGDIITRVDGIRVPTFLDFYNRVAFHPTGVIELRIRDIRTGSYVDLTGIQLLPLGGPGPGPGSWTRTFA